MDFLGGFVGGGVFFLGFCWGWVGGVERAWSGVGFLGSDDLRGAVRGEG